MKSKYSNLSDLTLEDIWHRIPTKEYGPQGVEMPVFMFVMSVALILPVPLAMFYTEAYSFLLGCFFVPLWVSILGIRSVAGAFRSKYMVQSSKSLTRKD